MSVTTQGNGKPFPAEPLAAKQKVKIVWKKKKT